MISKSDQITALALEILEDAEMSRTSVEAPVMKASRLARLVDDEEAIDWLYYERFGYNDSDKISLKYLALTNRFVDVPMKTAYYGSIITQEAVIEGQQHQLDVVKNFNPSGEWAATHFANQQNEAAKLTNTICAARRILSAVRAQVQEFATRIYYEKLFSHQAETIFVQYQNEVDTLLSITAKTAFARLPQAFERLGAGDPESISHALTTCRRVIDSFTDAVFTARADPARIGEQDIKVGAHEIRNRLRAYVYGHMGQGSRYERLNRAIKEGVHHACCDGDCCGNDASLRAGRGIRTRCGAA
jgi:AbiTii